MMFAELCLHPDRSTNEVAMSYRILPSCKPCAASAAAVYSYLAPNIPATRNTQRKAPHHEHINAPRPPLCDRCHRHLPASLARHNVAHKPGLRPSEPWAASHSPALGDRFVFLPLPGPQLGALGGWHLPWPGRAARRYRWPGIAEPVAVCASADTSSGDLFELYGRALLYTKRSRLLYSTTCGCYARCIGIARNDEAFRSPSCSPKRRVSRSLSSISIRQA
jgi:hypothetical protein